MTPRARRRLTAIVGLAVSLALLAWVLRKTSLQDLATHLREAHRGPLLAAVVIATASFPLRAVRWRLLLRTPEDRPVSWRALWHATAMGFMANNTLPLRLGEVVRSYAASRLGGVTVATALSSVAVERALDLLTLVGLLAVALLRAGLPAGTVVMGVRLDALAVRAALLCGVIFVVALFVVLFPSASERILRRLVPFPRLANWLQGIGNSLRQGFSVLRSPGRLALAVFWSVVIWLAGSAAFYVAFAAFDIPVGFAGGMLVQALLAFGVAAPSSPGYFGIFEVVAAAALGLFGIPTALGVAYGITFHITTFIPITLLGLFSLVRTGLHVHEAVAARA